MGTAGRRSREPDDVLHIELAVGLLLESAHVAGEIGWDRWQAGQLGERRRRSGAAACQTRQSSMPARSAQLELGVARVTVP